MKYFISLISFLYFLIPVHAEWLAFRGSLGNGSSEFAGPGKIVLKGEGSWVTQLPGRGLSSPVIANETVFLTASSGPNQETLHILAFGTEDGKKLWERKFKATGRTICHKKTCVAASTLASDGQLLIAQFSSNDVFCLDLLGNLRWLRGLTFDHPNIANGLGMSSSPLIVGGNAIIQVENDADSFSFGLNLTDGTTSWKKERPRAANWTSPISLKYKGQEIVGLQSKEGLTAIDPKTGENLWAYQDGASTMSSSTWTKENILLIPSNGLTAIKLNSNMLEFEQIWRENKLKPGTGSPSSKDGKVYVVNNANVLTCASVQTGEIIWRLRLEGPISSSSVLGGHYLFVFSETGLGQIVDLRDESPRVIHSVNLDDTILCTPAVSRGSIFVRSDAKLWKLEGI